MKHLEYMYNYRNSIVAQIFFNFIKHVVLIYVIKTYLYKIVIYAKLLMFL